MLVSGAMDCKDYIVKAAIPAVQQIEAVLNKKKKNSTIFFFSMTAFLLYDPLMESFKTSDQAKIEPSLPSTINPTKEKEPIG